MWKSFKHLQYFYKLYLKLYCKLINLLIQFTNSAGAITISPRNTCFLPQTTSYQHFISFVYTINFLFIFLYYNCSPFSLIIENYRYKKTHIYTKVEWLKNYYSSANMKKENNSRFSQNNVLF